MSLDYPLFVHDNETLIIKPGEQFTTEELKFRLRLAGIDANDIQNKKFLIQLYDSNISMDDKKLRLLDKLREDTEKYKKLNKVNLNMRNGIKIQTNVIVNKEMNIKDQPFNKRVQLKRANKITEKSFNNMQENLIINSDDIQNDENKMRSIFKQIIFHIISGIIILSISLGFLYIYRIYSEEINKIISRFFGFVTNYDFYWYIIGFVLIFILYLVIAKLVEKKNIKKRCRSIIKKMKENNEDFSEEEIYKRYLQNDGVSYKKFKKKYLPILNKMKK